MIKVLRLLEYEFDDYEVAEANMANWAVPANGIKNFGRGGRSRVVRSTILISPEKESNGN